MNYKLRLVLNVLKSKEEKEFILYDGQKMLLSPVGDGKTVNISVGEEETYKTKGAEAFLKRTEKILKQQADAAQDELAQIQNDILVLPGFPWVADLLMSFGEDTNEGHGPVFPDSWADRALVC